MRVTHIVTKKKTFLIDYPIIYDQGYLEEKNKRRTMEEKKLKKNIVFDSRAK